MPCGKTSINRDCISLESVKVIKVMQKKLSVVK